MKAAFAILVLAGLGAAQFDATDAGLDECRKNCCIRAGGSYDAALGECDADAAGHNDYQRCRNECAEIAAREYGAVGGGAYACCAPAALLPCLLFYVIRKG